MVSYTPHAWRFCHVVRHVPYKGLQGEGFSSNFWQYDPWFHIWAKASEHIYIVYGWRPQEWSLCENYGVWCLRACVLEVPFVLVFNFFSPTLVFFAILEMWIALSTHCCMTLHRKHYSIMFFIFFNNNPLCFSTNNSIDMRS